MDTIGGGWYASLHCKGNLEEGLVGFNKESSKDLVEEDFVEDVRGREVWEEKYPIIAWPTLRALL